MVEIEDIGLFKELTNRTDRTSKYYSSFVKPLIHDMSSILQNIKVLFPEYPDHGIDHSLRILRYISEICRESIFHYLSSLDIFVLIFSALFHDAGMSLYNAKEEEKEIIRKNHHLAAEKVVNIYFDDYVKNIEGSERIKKAIIFVCKAHGYTIDELIGDEKFRIKDRVNSLEIHYGVLAFLLRIGDLMDIEEDRVNNFRMMLFSSSYQTLSYEHNQRHMKVERYSYSPQELEIEVVADNIQQYKIWDDWFEFLEGDIEKFNACFAHEQLYLPMPNTKIKKADGATFEAQRLRFEIDEKGGMWNVISQSIYTNELDFLRELIQNAIDASLKMVYMNDENNIEHMSPRAWGDLAEPIVVCYSESKNSLYVIDQGIGMGLEELSNFLFRVSSTGKVHNEIRGFEFPGIAKYGIGFVSCLINADMIDIFTSNDRAYLNKVSLEANRKYAFIEKLSNSIGYIGTTVALKLKQKYTDEQINNYIKKTFCYPSVSIHFVDLDHTEAFLRNKEEKLIEEFYENPYCYNNLMTNIITVSDQKLRVLKAEKDKEKKVQNDFFELKKFFTANNMRFRKDEVLKEYNKKVSEFSGLIEQDHIKKLADKLLISKKPTSMDEEDSISEELNKVFDLCDEEILNVLAPIFSSIKENTFPINVIKNNKIDLYEDWRYLVAYLDEDLSVKSIVKYRTQVDLSNARGIVLVRQSECDYDKGIEYVAINGFLFDSGKIQNRLVKIYEVEADTYQRKRSFVVGIYDKGYSLKSEIHDFFSDERYYDYDEIGEADYEDWFPENIDTIYDEMRVVNNKIKKYLDKDYNSYDDQFYASNYEEGDYRSEEIINYELLKETLHEEFNNILRYEHDFFYQDGIAIPNKINRLVPLGLFRIWCNCTADSRMKLNVTRHGSSEIENDVDQWFKDTGSLIQKKILNGLKNSFNELGLQTVNMHNYLWDEQPDWTLFERKSYKSMSKIISEMR